MAGPERESLTILERGRPLALDYRGALAAHGGESWFGVAVAFRMLQAAGEILSRPVTWSREPLRVLSGHPGDGARDAVEYVTRCVSRKRYTVLGEEVQGASRGCSRAMRFAWEVEDGQRAVTVQLRDGFVPEAFFDLLDRLGTAAEQPADRTAFARAKRGLAEAVWAESLSSLFTVQCAEVALAGHA